MSSRCDFRDIQRRFTHAIRKQADYEPPACGRPLEARRMAVYQKLFLNTVSQFFAGIFPVCHQILGKTRWDTLMRAFLAHHGAHTPYFHWLGKEFLTFLDSDAYEPDRDPPWLKALADWEWQEVAAGMDSTEVPAASPAPLEMTARIVCNPTLRVCQYDWPVHQAAPGVSLPERPVFLGIWRDAADEVHFVQLAPLMAALLILLERPRPLHAALEELGQQCGQPEEVLWEQARPFLEKLYGQNALCRVT